MDDLLHYYERELVRLRRDCREFADSYPKVAERLQLGGDVCGDPHVERLTQSSALLAARVAMRLDDNYPQFTADYLAKVFPQCLRPFPSCAVICADRPGLASAGDGSTVIPRGTQLESALIEDVRCTFKTVYDISLAPIVLASATFQGTARAPIGVSLPSAACAGISITIAASASQADLSALAVDTVRVCINGEPALCGVLRDALFMHTLCAYIEPGDAEHWIRLSEVPLATVGFAAEDALLPAAAYPNDALRLLHEHFVFPEKFHFFDLDLPAIRKRLPAQCRHFTLHLALARLGPDSDGARMLRGMSKDNLLLGCSPVVNLFERAAETTSSTKQASDCTVSPHPTHPQAFEIYAIDSVQATLTGERGGMRQYQAADSPKRGGGERDQVYYWGRQGGESADFTGACHQQKIRLMDAQYQPSAVITSNLVIRLTCTNGELPGRLKYGQPAGDLTSVAAADGSRIRLLQRPTPSVRAPGKRDWPWRMISSLTLNHHHLVQSALPDLRETLELHDWRQSAPAQRQINGIVGLSNERTSAWMHLKEGPCLARGIEVRLAIDEDAFRGRGLHLLTQVLDHYFALYVQFNSFTELVFTQQSGEELIRYLPREGLLLPA